MLAVDGKNDPAEPPLEFWFQQDCLHFFGHESGWASVSSATHSTYYMVNVLSKTIYEQRNQPRTRYSCPLCAAMRYTNRILLLKSSRSSGFLNSARSGVKRGARGAATVMTETMRRSLVASSTQSLSRSCLKMTTPGEKMPAVDPGPRFGQG
jgi:hypothetical protein